MKKLIYVLGGAQTDFQRNWTKEGKGFIAMLKEVVHHALNVVSIDFEEIEKLNKNKSVGIFIGNFDGQQYFNQGHLGSFLTEINNSFIGIPGARYEAACASGSVAIDIASTKIRADEIDVAIVIGIELMKSVPSQIGADFLGTAAFYEKEAKGVLYPFPKLFGKLADEILKKYHLKESVFLNDLAEIARINYSNAKKNPNAQTRSWFINKDHILSRNDNYNSSIGGKLSFADCSQITDGASMLILSSQKYASEYAKKRKIKMSKLPYIKGYGFNIAPILFKNKMIESRKSNYILPRTKQAIDDAYSMAQLTIDQIDVIETHDCFTSSEYMAISAFGLCEPGEEHKIITEGVIGYKGKKPINPSGGLIGVGHPVGATGVRMMLDLYKQVTNNAKTYQIESAKNGLMLNMGGSATTNIVFILGI